VIEFQPWPKIARLNRGMVLTEKIDGTNAAIHIQPEFDDPNALPENWQVVAQSRTRLITPEQDNFGFARWVAEHRDSLIRDLGQGVHFGEWWGLGIQRGYGQDRKRFSLFNTARFGPRLDHEPFETQDMDVVPVIYEGNFNTGVIDNAVEYMRDLGSHAVPGWMKPEGVVVYLPAARTMFKVTLEGDEKPKGAQE